MSTHSDDSVAAEIAAIEADFPHWHIWRARRDDERPGDLMATRRRDLSTDELSAGLARTLPMGFHGDLRTQLAEQTMRERALGGDTP